MATKTLDDVANVLLNANSALVFCHVRPDGDTVGSAVALKFALECIGKKCDLVCDSDYPSKLEYLPYSPLFSKPEKIKSRYDVHVATDVASENLLGGSWGLFKSNENTVNVDHHLSNERYAKLNYVETVASTTVIIFNLIKKLGVDIDEKIANAVLLGIVTDTGVFTNPNTDAAALRVASDAMELGADFKKISYETRKTSKEKNRLLSQVLLKTRYLFDGKLAIVTTTAEMLSEHGLKNDATEGFADYPLLIEGVVVSVAVLQDKRNLYRVSFRSRGDVNVNDVAAEFGGGGHVCASGCVVKGYYEEVIERIARAVEVNSDF